VLFFVPFASTLIKKAIPEVAHQAEDRGREARVRRCVWRSKSAAPLSGGEGGLHVGVHGQTSVGILLFRSDLARQKRGSGKGGNVRQRAPAMRHRQAPASAAQGAVRTDRLPCLRTHGKAGEQRRELAGRWCWDCSASLLLACWARVAGAVFPHLSPGWKNDLAS
jgi:hypothetical protein